jgi:acetyl esterase
MALDPQARAVIEQAARAPLPAYSEVGAVEARRLYKATRAVLSPPASAVDEARDLSMPGPGGDLPLRLYRPLNPGKEPLPVLLFFHGGGWTVGDLDTHDEVCRALANAARCAVVAVDYRLAPEHKFPAAVEDCVAATRWVAAQGAKLGIDASRLAVGGDSAGGNLAAVVALTLRDAGGPKLALQLLIYPATDQTLEGESPRLYGEGYLLTLPAMIWYRDNYLRGEADVTDWRASPFCAADLSRLPPAYILTAGFDPLLDEGRAYAGRLRESGVDVTYECFEGMVHGFLIMGGVIAAANHAIYRSAQMLTRVFYKAAGSA